MRIDSRHFVTTICLVGLALGCVQSEPTEKDPLAGRTWSEIDAAARGGRVHMLMWMGDPYINAYMRDYVIPEVERRHGIRMTIGSSQGSQVVSMIMTELEAGAETSAADLVWINGETFYQLRQIDALYGPFTDLLPNSRLVDYDNPFISIDFQQPIEGFESPWGNVQFVLIYDTERVANPPATRAALFEWVRAHPGRFTFDSAFSGMTLLKSWLIDIAGGPETLAGPFNENAYVRYSTEMWSWINDAKPFFWKKGKTFPSTLSQMHRLFVNREIDFTMSNNDGEVDNKVLQGLFPESTKAYVLENGTIRNTHYVGIPRRAANKNEAMVVANFLLSPDAQLQKLNPSVWGDGTVLDLNRLPDSIRTKFQALPTRRYSPKRQEIEKYALPELDAAYMIRLYDDFRRFVIDQ